MALTPEEIEVLDARAQEVGASVGWELHFRVAPNSEYLGVTAGPDHIFIIGPSKLADMAAHDIDLDLDAIERGEKRIVPDEDGDPRLWTVA